MIRSARVASSRLQGLGHCRRLHPHTRRCPASTSCAHGDRRLTSTSARDDEYAPATAQLATNDELSAIVDQFPAGIDYAFGYGSGVLSQQSARGDKSKPGMVDVILAVDDPRAFHERNLQCHKDHYSAMAQVGGPKFVTWLQVNFGANIYFHPFVNVDIAMDVEGRTQTVKREIKYGVVSTDDLIRDLLHWDYLYLAGRMHKPIVPIELPSRSDRRREIDEAQRANLLSAVSASLLLCDDARTHSLSVGRLYHQIASLSYTGDIRMATGAEDPDKVQKLVEAPGMADLWEVKYSTTLDGLENLGVLSVVDGNRVECNATDVATRKQLVQNLPPRLQMHSDQIVGTDGSPSSVQKGSEVLRRELANIVAPAAKGQTMKGIVTAGAYKSGKYALAKLAKGWLK